MQQPKELNVETETEQIKKIITLYEPDPVRWVDFKKRRPQ